MQNNLAKHRKRMDAKALIRTRLYSKFRPNKKHTLPGVPGVRWGWFRDTFTQTDLLVILGVNNHDKAELCWNALVTDCRIGDPVDGRFSGLHVEMKSEDAMYGSVVFLENKARSSMAHEIGHAAKSILGYLGIENEEAECTAISSWMVIVQGIFGLKD